MMTNILIIAIVCGILAVNGLNYTYYTFAIQNFCDEENQYYVHGMWPQFNSSSYPEYCSNITYEDVTGDLLTDMNQYWNICDQVNQSFWKHEWLKHGSCVNVQTGITEYDYFNLTINLFKQLLSTQSNLWNETCAESSSACIIQCYALNFTEIAC